MEIRISCTGCGKNYRVKDNLIGKFLKCKKCETFLEIVDPRGEAVESLEEVVDAPPEGAQVQPAGFDPLAGTQVPTSPAQPVAPHPGQQPVHPQQHPQAVHPQAVHPQPVHPQAVHPQAVHPQAVHPQAAQPMHAAQPAAVPGQPSYGAPAAKGPVKKIGGLERALLLFGAFLFILGMVLILFKLEGTQVGRLGSAKPLIGLALGLLGSALLGIGLRRILIAAIVTGLVTALISLIIFGLSFLGNDNIERIGQGGGIPSHSDWLEKYPGWSALSSNLEKGGIAEIGGASISDVWPRFDLNEIGASILFPSERRPDLKSGTLTLSDQTFDTKSFERKTNSGNSLLYSLRFFQAKNASGSTTEKLAAFEKLFKEQLSPENYQSSEQFVDDLPAREIQYSTSGGAAVHQYLIVREDLVYVALVSGPENSVPGRESRKFLRSIEFDISWSPDVDDSGALDPFSFPGGDDSGNDSNNGAADEAPISTANFQMTSVEAKRKSMISERRRKLQRIMDNEMGTRIRLSFPDAYLTEMVGPDTRSSKNYAVHPNKLPINGVDLVFSERGPETAVSMIAPIYDRKATDGQSIIAPEGFAVAAINVNLQERLPGIKHVAGLQLVFMKPTASGFDTSTAQAGEWQGTAPRSGSGIQVGGDGRPVYGFYDHSGLTMNSLGLIVEPQFSR